MVTSLLTLVYIYAVAWRHLMGGHLLMTAVAAFLAYQLPNSVGTILNAHFTESFDLYWVAVRLAGLAAFVAGALYASHSLGFQARDEVLVFRKAPLIDDLKGSVSGLAVATTVTASLIVGFVFASRIGYNTFAQSLIEYASSGSVDKDQFSTLRADATLDGYAAAGYAVQFTAVILPALIIMVILRGRLQRRVLIVLGALVLTALDIYFLTVVGGRKYLIGTIGMVILLLLPATSPLPPRLRASKGTSAGLVLSIFALFGFSTLLQGRAANSSILRESTVGFYDRLAGDYSFYQFESLRLLRDDPTAWGKLWLDQLQIALPGTGNTLTFDERLHGLLFGGNTRGNSPLDFWGSTYYNWSAVGVIVVAFALGFALQHFSVKHLIRAPKTLTRVVLFTLAGYRFALSRDPYSVLLEGGITLIVFFYLHKAVRGRQSRTEAAPLHAGGIRHSPERRRLW